MSDIRKVLVIGATGFTGQHVVPRLLARGYEVTCLVRPTSRRESITRPNVLLAEGNLSDPDSIRTALQGKDALVNIAYLVSGNDRQGTRASNLVRACHAAKVRRAVFLSSTSVFTKISAPAKEAKLAAEEAVFSSGLDYTLLRPTMIYGTTGDRNLIRLIRFLNRSPVLPIPGSGEFRLQPVHVDDLAEAIVSCLNVPVTFGKAYNLSGPHGITFNELVDQTCHGLRVKRLKVHLPLLPALLMARLFSRSRRKGRIKEEQILRLNEHKCFDHSEARRDFGFSPRSFSEGITQEVAQYRKEQKHSNSEMQSGSAKLQNRASTQPFLNSEFVKK